MLEFETIDPEKHREIIVPFRRDSFVVSFGTDQDFGDPEDYLRWVKKNVEKFPDGFVLVKQDGEYIGQLELQIIENEKQRAGYANLYYLIPPMRGKGLGEQLFSYSLAFFQKHGVSEFFLRVSPSNTPALRFYRKMGMEEVGTEFDGKVIRMRGYVNPGK